MSNELATASSNNLKCVYNWITMASYPNPDWTATRLVQINKNEFIRCSMGDPDKYNIIENKWDKLILPLPTNTDLSCDAVAFDKTLQILFIYAADKIMEINMKTNESVIHDHNINIGHSARGIVADHTFNIIGGCDNTKHYVWNHHKLEQQYDFTDNEDEEQYFVRCEIVHVPSKNTLFCIGGFDGIHSKDSIFSYDITNRKWSKLKGNLPREISEFGCVSSRDERYIILLGGNNNDNNLHDINVWDIRNMTFSKSSIVCPVKGFIQAINMNDPEIDELLTFGFIRTLWSYPQFSNILYPPFYLIKMVGSYYSNEWIYVIEQEHGHHWKIKLDHIIAKCH